MNRATNPYAGYRYPAEIISHAVWLYFRFTLSFRDIEEIPTTRGIFVTYETIRQGCLKFGQPLANEVRRRLPRPGDQWHLDEGYCQLVEMQTQFTRDERCFRELGCLLDARHLLPGGKGLRADRPGVGGGQEVPATAKPMVDPAGARGAIPC